jgi:ribosomal protein S11
MFQNSILIKTNEFGDFEDFSLPCFATNEFYTIVNLVSDLQTPYTFDDVESPKMQSVIRYLRYTVFSGQCEDKYNGLNLVCTFMLQPKLVIIPFMSSQLGYFADRVVNEEIQLNRDNVNGCLFYALVFWLYWFTPVFCELSSLILRLENRYLFVVAPLSSMFAARVGENASVLKRSFMLRYAHSWRILNRFSLSGSIINLSPKLLRAGQSRYFFRFLSLKTTSSSRFRFLYFTKFRKLLRKSFWFRSSRFRYSLAVRAKIRYLRRFFPRQILRQFRFVRKFRARFTVRALHTNLFFTIRQGNNYFLASTGMFDDLKRGTKRKRTLMAGWFLADRLFSNVSDLLKIKSIFRIDIYGRTSGRRGIWFSWRTKQWRIFQVYSRTPIAFNGTRARRKRRL